MPSSICIATYEKHLHENCNMNFLPLGDTLDGMKNSPAPGTPREEGPPMGDYGIPGYGQENVCTFLLFFVFKSFSFVYYLY